MWLGQLTVWICGDVELHIKECQVIIFKKSCILLSEDLFNIHSVDPDEMQHDNAFHLGLNCLKKKSFRGFPNIKG